ncbi:MAG: DUF4416 family protein [Synergistaceae bacterium]|nr:DUF4416 family protein [Synergistaceae bacterium]
MSDPKVKLIAGVLYPDGEEGEGWFAWTLGKLKALWGEHENVSPPVPFAATDYYRDIAPRLARRFVCFEGLARAGDLPDWKHASIGVEGESRNPRIVNIDPGYVDGARLVLASTKDHAHRVYLRNGIFAEVTMRFRFGKWMPFDYTFPDFAGGAYDRFLSAARESWLEGKRRTKQ